MAHSTLGHWHGKKYYLGLHYDLHAGAGDTELGTHCAPEQLIPMLKTMKPDFVQTDCKGHPGMTSWLSQVPEATVSPGVVKDALLQWREATSELKMPLHCHYSGIWDRAAAKKHPEWTVVSADGSRTTEKMCPRGPYLEKLMIPQLLELIDRYHVDGFWIDGDIWAVEPCYCDACKAAFSERTGISEPPKNVGEAHWTEWINFQRESFCGYVARYVKAVHEHAPGVLVCSNWLQTFKNPGEPSVDTDWISGDNPWIWGFDRSRCEARWLCNRGKPWDIMLWSFSKTQAMGDQTSPWIMKPVQMLEQEAAMLLSTGGNVQIYETTNLRNGQLVPWRMNRLKEVSEFIHKRKAVCQESNPFPVAAVLHSEVHYYSEARTSSIMYAYDIAPVEGAVYCLSDAQIPLDILDEPALAEHIDVYPVVVVPEQSRMSDEMVAILKQYVQEGGLLLVSGAETAERFGLGYLGIASMERSENTVFHLPVGRTEMFPLYSSVWGKITPMKSARTYGKLGWTSLRNERLTDYPAAVMKHHGDGTVMFVPAELFRDYARNRYPETAAFLKEIVDKLYPDPPFTITAPKGVEVVTRCNKKGIFFHFINRLSGLPTSSGQGMIDEIPPIGPVKLTINLGWKPQVVKWHFEDENEMSFTWAPEEHEHEHEHEHGDDCECGCSHEEHGDDCECGCSHEEHGDDCDCGCCHEEHGEDGVLTVTIQHLKIHGALQIQ